MKTYIKIAIMALSLSGANALAQTGIGGNNRPSKSAALDLGSSNKGLLIPRISLASTADVTSVLPDGVTGKSAQSVLVFNTNAGITGTNAAGTGYYYWDNTIWKKMIVKDDVAESNDWTLLGNTGIIPTTNFLGTTDANDLIFRTNNVGAARITSGGNFTMGTGAGPANTADAATVATATSGSTTVQQEALLTVAGGDASINGITVGKGGGQKNNNTAIGNQVLSNNTTGGLNVGTGFRALEKNNTGSTNSAYGGGALNSLMGSQSSRNVALGESSLSSLTTGFDNLAIGFAAGNLQVSGNSNIVIGGGTSGMNVADLNGSFQLNLANIIFGIGINSGNIGNGKIGIGTTAPGAKLEVKSDTAGAIKIVDGTQGDKKVLTSDANGLATWKPAALTTYDVPLGTGVNIVSGITGGVYTGTTLVLPPGKWLVTVNMLMTKQIATAPTESWWISSSFSDSTTSLVPSPDIVSTSKLVSGLLPPNSNYSQLKGTVVIENTTSANKTYYYWAGQGNVGVNDNVNASGSLSYFGGNAWSEDYIYYQGIN